MNVVELLALARDVAGDGVAVSAHGRDLTRAGLLDGAARAARAVTGAGVERVAYVGVAGLGFPVAFFGAAWAGVPFFPVNYRLGDDQMAEVLAGAGRWLVLADDATRDRVRALGVDAHPASEWVDGLAAVAPAAPRSWATGSEAVAVLLATSGTTSRPKSAVLRHRHLVSYLLNTVDVGSAGPGEAALVAVPPYHIAGVSNLLSNTFSGRRIVYLPDFSAPAWLDAVEREGITHALVVPTMLARVVEHLEATGRAAPPVASIAYGGAPMPPELIARALAAFPGTGFVNAYGLTETSSTVAVLGPEDHRAALASDDPRVRARLGSVGRAVPGTEIEVRDEDGAPVAPGTPGVLHVRGPQVSGEYLDQGAAVADGWFPTRDRAVVDEDGYLFVLGRADDTIIRGGENIAPEEVEEVLRDHPAVADAAVFGIPDPEWGQRIGAAVVAVGPVDGDELRALVRSRLRSSKTPDEVVVVEDLPRTETGKVLRRVLAAGFAPAPAEGG